MTYIHLKLDGKIKYCMRFFNSQWMSCTLCACLYHFFLEYKSSLPHGLSVFWISDHCHPLQRKINCFSLSFEQTNKQQKVHQQMAWERLKSLPLFVWATRCTICSLALWIISLNCCAWKVWNCFSWVSSALSILRSPRSVDALTSRALWSLTRPKYRTWYWEVGNIKKIKVWNREMHA